MGCGLNSKIPLVEVYEALTGLSSGVSFLI